MIIAAEASSAAYAIKLMKELKVIFNDQIHFFGVGSDEMEKAGFERIGKSEEMAIVGLTEVIKHLGFLKSIFNNLLLAAQKYKADAVILMDYPDFNLRLAKKLKENNHKVYYYISPQIWAWRQSRIHQMKAYCQKVYLLFKFEKLFYDKYEVPNEFVGHPLLEDLTDDLFNAQKIQLNREKYGIKKNEKVLALMPGSRHGEIERHFDLQLQAGREIVKKYPHVRLLICVAPTLAKNDLLKKLDHFGTPYLLLKEDPNYMISLADYVLVASGTATLMVGLLHKPMVIMYKMSGLTYRIAQWLVRGVKLFGLINLVHERKIVPELLQNEANVVNLVKEVEKYILDEKYTSTVIDQLKGTNSILGQGLDSASATDRVAKSLYKEMTQS